MAQYWRDYDYMTTDYYWWGSPSGWSDYDLYDYNNNFILDDEEIEDIVRDNLAADPGITLSDQQQIEVTVKDGNVTLSGVVRNPRSKPLAYADAYWSSGVLDVKNEITVKPRKRRESVNGKKSRTKKETGQRSGK